MALDSKGDSLVTEIVTALGGTAILVGAVAWLTRSIIIHFLSKDVETFKQQLTHQSSLEIERVKHDLRLIAVEHEQRTALLHERRADVIAKLYQLLVEFLDAAESFAAVVEYSGESSKPEKAKTFNKKAFDFHQFFRANRIYFSEATCAAVDELFREVGSSISGFQLWLGISQTQERAMEKMDQAWSNAWDSIQKKVPPLLMIVQNEFRGILGVPTSVETKGLKGPWSS